MEHCGPCPRASAPPRVYRPPVVSAPVVSAPAAPPPDPAIALIDDGDAAYERGDWDAAISHYKAALESRPGDEDILTRLRNAINRRQMEINARVDEKGSADIAGVIRRVEDETHEAPVEAVLQHAEDESAEQRLSAMYDNAHDASVSDTAPAVRAGDGSAQPLYPIFLGPVPANSPPVKVLAQLQPQVRDIDKEIRRAQEALRRLIESNAKGGEEREAWVKESEEATVDAQDLSLSLLLDLIGERADELADANKETRKVVLDRLLAECDKNGPSKRIVDGYKTLVGTEKDLERLKQELRLAGKEDDLRVKIRDFSTDRAEPNLEIVWDVVSQFQIVEDLTGPWEHMLNASYTIYRQATSMQRLTQFQENDEKTYQASKTLGLLMRKLEAQRKAEAARKKP
jgi:tetratricopeptide (TPR) repeat protein